jgi:hypothetical protein
MFTGILEERAVSILGQRNKQNMEKWYRYREKEG